jgi:hypothetical protein
MLDYYLINVSAKQMFHLTHHRYVFISCVQDANVCKALNSF